jgi:hypothetical protein
MSKSINQAQAAKKSLLQHSVIMLVAVTTLQLFLYAKGSAIDGSANLGLVIIALYYLWYHYSSRDLLARVRFGRLVARLVGFIIVNVSYHLHAFILYVTNNPAIRGDKDFSINPGWFGVLFGMTTFWGIGLLIHMIASIANRGFEELPRG